MTLTKSLSCFAAKSDASFSNKLNWFLDLTKMDSDAKLFLFEDIKMTLSWESADDDDSNDYCHSEKRKGLTLAYFDTYFADFHQHWIDMNNMDIFWNISVNIHK